jgi:16S rRNA (cytosine1402-N4)-methyltransferase
MPMRKSWSIRIMDNTNFHVPVLKSESINQLVTDKNGIYIDATLGYGGHTKAILDATSEKSKIFGIDKDLDAIDFNNKEFVDEKRFTLKHGCFSSIQDYAKSWNIFGSVNGILFDLGVSSVHLDDANLTKTLHWICDLIEVLVKLLLSTLMNCQRKKSKKY